MSTKSRTLAYLDVFSIILLVIATIMVFFYAPEEAVMGLVQKVFYFHVATAWVGSLGFLVAFIAGIAYLRTGKHGWDLVGFSAVEVAMAFLLITIITGSIWARPVWNTWWTWDPRLTTATIMELVYAAYIMLRSGIEDPDRRARFGAVYAIIGFISVPLTFLSIRFFRTIHPVVIGGNDPSAQGAFDMTPKMLTTFMTSLFVFSVVFVDLLWHRIRLGRLADSVEQLKMKLIQ
jgi:heme exporter protein C